MRSRALTLWTRAVEVAVLAVAVCFSIGASSPSSRLSDLDHRLMCQCGCAQLLGECDHVGCPDRDKELAELSADIASGMTDQQDICRLHRKIRRRRAGRTNHPRL